MNSINSNGYRPPPQASANINGNTGSDYGSKQPLFSLFPEELSVFIKNSILIRKNHGNSYQLPDNYPNKGQMLCNLFWNLNYYFQSIVTQGPQNFSTNSNQETHWVTITKDIEQLYDGLSILTNQYKQVLQNTDASSWLHPKNQEFLVEHSQDFERYSGTDGKNLVLTALAQRLSEIDELSPGSLCQILESLRHCAVHGFFNIFITGHTIKFHTNGFDAMMDAVIKHVSQAKALDALEVTLLFEILPKLNDKKRIDAILKELPQHISKLVDLDKIVNRNYSSLQRTHNSALQKMVFALDCWACSKFAGDVLKALAESISNQAQLGLDDTGILLYLLEEVASIKESADLMEALTPHIDSNAGGFDLVDMSRAFSCLHRIKKDNRMQILSALTIRLNTIQDSDGAEIEENVKPLKLISTSDMSSFHYLRKCHKNANNFDEDMISYGSSMTRSGFNNVDSSDDSYDPDDPDNSYEIDTDAPSFSWSVCLAANSIQSLSSLLKEQNGTNAAKGFIDILLKKMNYSFDVQKLNSIYEQQMLVKDLLEDRRTKTQIDLRGLPVDLAEFYLHSVLNEIRHKKSVLPALTLAYGSLANAIYSKSTFLPLTIVYSSYDMGQARPKNLRSVVENSISKELMSGELRARWDNGSVVLKKPKAH